jgi:hypothetical protein
MSAAKGTDTHNRLVKQHQKLVNMSEIKFNQSVRLNMKFFYDEN